MIAISYRTYHQRLLRILSLLCILNILFVLGLVPLPVVASSCRRVTTQGALTQLPDSVWGARELNSYFPINRRLKVGVEIEALVPKRIGFVGLSHLIELELFKQIKPSNNHHVVQFFITRDDSQSITYGRNNHAYNYVIDEETGINYDEDYIPVEIKSPILRNQFDVEVFLKIVQRLKQHGGLRAEQDTAGVHIHVDFPRPRLGEVQLLAKVFAAIEKQLMKKWRVSRWRRHNFAQTLGPKITTQISELKPPFRYEELQNILPHRHFALNFQALQRHGTVEFRLFNSSVRAQRVREMMWFCAQLVRMIRHKDPELIAFLSQQDPAAETLPLDQLINAMATIDTVL